MDNEIPRKIAVGSTIGPPSMITLACPDCGAFGTFEPIYSLNDFIVQTKRIKQGVANHYSWRFGQRKCPAPNCQAHVFIVARNNEVVLSYPPQRIDFNKEYIPESITQTLEEAITCYAERCFVASAIMVRRTLEEICENRGAKGNNLWQRIRKLKEMVVISEGLIDGMGNLILLGNDAAHVESRTFEQVSREEVELSIEITKEILRAVYQEKSLVEKLNRLKKPTS